MTAGNPQKDIPLPIETQAQAVFDGTVALHQLLDTQVIPVIQSVVNPSSYELALQGIFYRMFAWSHTLNALNKGVHIQAVCGAARSMFELLLDIKGLIAARKRSAADADEAAQKFHAFTKVERVRTARMTVEHHDKQNGFDPTKHVSERALLSDPVRMDECKNLQASFWGYQKGKLVQPSGWENLTVADRARNAGQKYEDFYRYMYPRLSWFLHSGAAGFSGIDGDGFIGGFALAHSQCQDMLVDATEEIANELHLFASNPVLKENLSIARSIPGQSIVKAMQAIEATSVE
jgi:hypothetical protein